MRDRIVVQFYRTDTKSTVDVEIPLDITASELILGLDQAFSLNINIEDAKDCYLASENPIAFLHGNKTLREYGLRNGSIIIYQRGKL